jgi:putative iron-dependent peroxidase
VQNKESFEDQGSYIHVQRVKFDLNRWQQLSLSEQEAIMGRSRLENKKLETALVNNHAALTELKSSDNLPLLLEQSMPFGDVFEQGSLWVSCAAKGHAFERLLNTRVGNDQHYDAWVDYCQADMGAAFFAPSVQFLHKMAQLAEN